MGRIQGLVDLPVLTGSQLIKTGEGFVFSVTVAWTGAAVGAGVFLRDGLTSAGKALVPFVFATANGTITKEWPNGKAFSTGLFYDESGAQNVFIELTYK
jgi:hypothetical protein